MLKKHPSIKSKQYHLDWTSSRGMPSFLCKTGAAWQNAIAMLLKQGELNSSV